ncbi:MAG: hypothetical protein QGI29_04975 [Pirellulales bacterium]|nr:hypothetical protein [Pirellulales bacterium]
MPLNKATNPGGGLFLADISVGFLSSLVVAMQFGQVFLGCDRSALWCLRLRILDNGPAVNS